MYVCKVYLPCALYKIMFKYNIFVPLRLSPAWCALVCRGQLISAGFSFCLQRKREKGGEKKSKETKLDIKQRYDCVESGGKSPADVVSCLVL